ncbi:MAG: hypothetical protein MUE69_22965 [Myxococcota bacterium]|nr:hypothetical protein [Myxococcota bacterium]
MLVNSVSEMGYTALTSIPATRQLGTALAMAGGSAVTMGAALGPLGIGLALVGNLLPAIVNLFSGVGTEAASASRVMDRNREVVSSLADAMRDARNATNEYAQAAMGLLSIEEQQIRLGAARERVIGLQTQVRRAEAALERGRGLGAEFTTGGGFAGAEEQIRQLRAALNAAQRDAGDMAAGAGAAVARAEAARAKELAEQESNRAQAIRDMRNDGADERRREREEQLRVAKDKQLQLEQQILDIAAEAAAQDAAGLKELERRRLVEQEILAIREMQIAANTKASEAAANAALEEEMRGQKLVQSAKENTEYQRTQNELEERRIKITSRSQKGLEGIADIGQRIAELQRESNESFGKSFKTALAEWSKGFAIQSTYKGLAATAEAIGSAITNQPNAAAKAAEAAMHFAIAGALGGAGAALSSGGGGGGGGGGGARAARPEAVGGGGGGGGGGTTVINFNAPVSEAELGRMQQRAERARSRRFG